MFYKDKSWKILSGDLLLKTLSGINHSLWPCLHEWGLGKKILQWTQSWLFYFYSMKFSCKITRLFCLGYISKDHCINVIRNPSVDAEKKNDLFVWCFRKLFRKFIHNCWDQFCQWLMLLELSLYFFLFYFQVYKQSDSYHFTPWLVTVNRIL